jgi:hypothetical protein
MKANLCLMLANAGLGILMLAPWTAHSQAVQVTATLDAQTLTTGQTTTLRVLAQVVPGQRANAERIFSWHVDLVNTNGAAADAQYVAMIKAASDNGAGTASLGTSQGPNRLGIYDTFLNLAGAGVAAPVELMAIPVRGIVSGRTRFRVNAGTGPALFDFLVAPLEGGDPLFGGDYTAAFADLEVTQACPSNLKITAVNGGGPGKQLNITFTPCAGFDHTVVFTGMLRSAGTVWTPVAGGPHNSGMVSVTNNVAPRFFRVEVLPQ